MFPQAEESFLAALRLDPHLPGIHLELGKVYTSERRTDDAITQLKEALQENPRNEGANYFLGSLLVRENQYDQGITYLEEQSGSTRIPMACTCIWAGRNCILGKLRKPSGYYKRPLS